MLPSKEELESFESWMALVDNNLNEIANITKNISKRLKNLECDVDRLKKKDKK